MINFTRIKNLQKVGVSVKQASETPEISEEGVGLSPGIAIGRAYVYDPRMKVVPHYAVREEDVSAEFSRFLRAVEKTSDQLDAVKRQANLSLDDPVTQLFDVYRHILRQSRLVRGVEDRIRTTKVNAEYALQAEISRLADAFTEIQDTYLASRLDDIRGLAERIAKNFSASATEKTKRLPQNAIVFSERLTTADATSFDLSAVSGFIVERGSQQSHAALLARSLNLPAVIGVPDILSRVHTGDIVLIDGTYGKIIIHPTQDNITRYRHYRSDFLRWQRRLKRQKDMPSLTQDNVYVSLKGNIDLVSEVEVLRQAGVDGVGLLRSEYMFMNRSVLPTEEEQYQVLRTISERLDGRPITFRTLDVDGDKDISSLSFAATNPALGLRGIRCSLKYENVLRDQFSAALRASAYGDIRLLLPMISSVGELRRAKEILYAVADDLRAQGKEVPEKMPLLGVMIEVPGAAIEAETLARNCDFLSVGTNDLIQYTLAVDRTDETVASLYNPLHPAILKLLKMTADGARAAGVPLCVCGEMASVPLYAPILLGFGVRELSMPASNVPLVKERLRSMRMDEMEYFANSLLAYSEAADIQAVVKNFENRGK